MATNYYKLKKQLDELKYTDPNITVIEDEEGNKVSKSIKPTVTIPKNPNTFSPTVSNTKTTSKKANFPPRCGAAGAGHRGGEDYRRVL